MGRAVRGIARGITRGIARLPGKALKLGKGLLGKGLQLLKKVGPLALGVVGTALTGGALGAVLPGLMGGGGLFGGVLGGVGMGGFGGLGSMLGGWGGNLFGGLGGNMLGGLGGNLFGGVGGNLFGGIGGNLFGGGFSPLNVGFSLGGDSNGNFGASMNVSLNSGLGPANAFGFPPVFGVPQMAGVYLGAGANFF